MKFIEVICYTTLGVVAVVGAVAAAIVLIGVVVVATCYDIYIYMF